MTLRRQRPDSDDAPAAGRRRPTIVGLTDAGLASTGLGADTMALPTELALLLRISLPLASHRQRQAAVGFAVEDLIAEPLEASHVVLGPELAPGEYLAIVVRDAEMAAWGGRAIAAGQRLVPDALGLPVPVEGNLSVRETAGRVLIRRADGTGFATGTDTFGTFWRVEGMPQIVLFGGRLAEGLPVSATGLMPAAPTPEALRVDLLQGRHSRPDRDGRRLLARLGLVAGLALLAHGAILGADAFALGRIAEDREASLRTALAIRVPGLDPSVPLDEALRRALPQASAAGGGFLPLFVRIAEALAPMTGEIAMRNLAFDAADGSLAVMLEASDLAALQRVEAALGAAGLGVASGVATTGDGGAEARYVISGVGS